MPTDKNVSKHDRVVLNIDVTAEIDFIDNIYMRVLIFNEKLHLLLRQEFGDSLRLTENRTAIVQ